MKCVREDLKAHITDVVVGEAEASVRDQVLAHLETCASCREDRDQVSSVLGLLKEAPPWTPALEDGEGDALSTIQRQKIESLAARPAPAAPGQAHRVSRSWLALAASLSAVGLALVLARQSAQRPLEAPTPVASVENQLPQAPEGPMLPRPLVTATPDTRTTPAAERFRGPSGVTLSPEALSELRRQAQLDAGEGSPLDQASEVNEYEPLKEEAAKRLSDEGVVGGVSGGVAGGVAGGIVAPAPAPARGAAPRSVAPVETPSAPGEAAAAREAEIAQLRNNLAQTASPNLNPTADELRREIEEADARTRDRARLRELTREGNETDKLSALGYAEPPRKDLPAPPPQPRDMFFEAKGTNPFIVTAEDPQATFGLDVDTASYTLTRNYLNRGMLPPAAAVRVEEFVNAFPNNVAPDRGRHADSAFAVRVDGAPNPLHPGYHILRVAMKAKEIDSRERKAAHLTFVIDVSGSMAAENRLGLVKRSLALLVDRLDERDTIGIVVYGTSGRRVLAPTAASNRGAIMAAIERLRPEGSTNLQDGLDLGYEMALESFDRRASNRVVLCTDGVANTGRTEADSLLARIRSETKRGIDMMALGFGMGNYNDALLQRLADEGNGQYAYIDDLGEARSFFLRRLTSVLEVVARDAKAQVEFNPVRVERYRLLGYEKRDVADRDFRNDAVDAGEINAGHAVTALFEVKLTGTQRQGRIGTARIRYKTDPRSEGVEFTREIVDGALVGRFGQASAAFQTAFVAARFAEHLRQSYWVKDEALGAVHRLAVALPESQQTVELADLIGKAVRLQGPRTPED